jgi:hypothetical protein
LERGMSKLFILPYFKEKPWETLEIWSKRNLTLCYKFLENFINMKS